LESKIHNEAFTRPAGKKENAFSLVYTVVYWSWSLGENLPEQGTSQRSSKIRKNVRKHVAAMKTNCSDLLSWGD
jgi:hypothetical protein